MSSLNSSYIYAYKYLLVVGFVPLFLSGLNMSIYAAQSRPFPYDLSSFLVPYYSLCQPFAEWNGLLALLSFVFHCPRILSQRVYLICSYLNSVLFITVRSE